MPPGPRESPGPRVALFTDGACSGNPGPGGWAFILRDEATGREITASDGERQTTNNRMELMGAINGLERLTEPCRVNLYSDSKYVIDGLGGQMQDWKTRGWKRPRNKPVKNLELWQRLDELCTTHEVHPSWVRGHDNHTENERCDRMAVAAIERLDA